jgi:hypothetical protein
MVAEKEFGRVLRPPGGQPGPIAGSGRDGARSWAWPQNTIEVEVSGAAPGSGQSCRYPAVRGWRTLEA